MPLFEVAILEQPTKREVEEGTGQERLVFGPVCLVARDSQSAAIQAVMENPDKMAKTAKERMQVIVRPFA